jgi:hypothetical protein
VYFGRNVATTDLDVVRIFPVTIRAEEFIVNGMPAIFSGSIACTASYGMYTVISCLLVLRDMRSD